jgi:hypothetical protein
MSTYTKDELAGETYAVGYADTLLIVHTDGDLVVEFDLKQMKENDHVVYQTNNTVDDNLYRKTSGNYESPLKELLKDVEETFNLTIESVHLSGQAYHHGKEELADLDIGIVQTD